MDNKENKEALKEKEDKAFEAMRNAGKNLKEAREDKEDLGSQKSNRLWVWLGVLVLIFILIYWLFAIGTFGDLANWFNG